MVEQEKRKEISLKLATFKPELEFTVSNAEASGKPLIYISQKSTINKLNFSITNKTKKEIILKNQKSKFKITFGRLLKSSEVRNIQVTTVGESWDTLFLEENNITSLSLTPKQDIDFNPSTTFTFFLNNLLASNQPTSDNFTVCYENIGVLDDDCYVIKLFLQNPPTEELKDLTQSLICDWLDRNDKIVYTTEEEEDPISNKITFYITNKGFSALVDKPFGVEKPSFKISFLTIARPDKSEANPNVGYNALTYHDLAKDIYIKPISNAKENWEVIPGYGIENQNLIWELKPLSPEVLGAGSSIEVSLENIKTYLMPYITTMYIQYTNIPGYNDGYIALSVEKKAPTPGILSFYANAVNIKPEQEISLSWNTFAVDRLVLSYFEDGKVNSFDSKKNEIELVEDSYKLKPETATSYTLTAYKLDKMIDQKQLYIAVHEDFSFTMEVTPSESAVGGKINMIWSIKGSSKDYCILNPDEHMLPLKGQKEVIAKETTIFSMTAFNNKKEVTQEKIVKVYPPTITEFSYFCLLPGRGAIIESYISWITHYADTCFIKISSQDGEIINQSVAPNGDRYKISIDNKERKRVLLTCQLICISPDGTKQIMQKKDIDINPAIIFHDQ